MSQVRLMPGLLALLAVLAACGRGSAPAPAAGAPNLPAAPPATAVADEGPRIVMSDDNVHLEYHVLGRGDPAVVLVHGWAGNENYWHEQFGVLKARYTVVAVNLAGHGASGRNRTDWSIDNYARDVATIVKQVPNRQLVLVGHSMGATVALAAAPKIGARVIGIIAVEALRSVGLPPLTASEIETRVAPFQADFVGETRKLVNDSLFEKGANPLLVQKVAYDMSLSPPGVAVASLKGLLAVDFAQLLPQVHVPVYAINSDLMSTDVARIRRTLPDFTLDVLPGTGHFPMLEAPARFNPLLLKDIETLRLRAAQAAHSSGS
jgi:pimeloyl-ACP methyl ester carboxylesterase